MPYLFDEGLVRSLQDVRFATITCRHYWLRLYMPPDS
jgi:hypothetical protein